MKTEVIDGVLWARLVIASSNYMEERKEQVDDLNVFPVPDGDTGTNMSLTIAAAARAVQDHQDNDVSNVAGLIAQGALMGARGNSGVILSQLLAGFAKGVEEKKELDAASLAKGLEKAVETAYQAVMNPVEGSILTVSRESSLAAAEAAALQEATVLDTLKAAYSGAVKALEKTPDMLPVLQQAGVVDAGGQGYVFLLEGMLKALSGEGVHQTSSLTVKAKSETPKAGFFTGGLLEFQYCTEFILKKKEKDLPLEEIRAFLADKGDCLLVVGSPEMSKIHIHTNHPGQVLEYCTGLGSLHEIQINNMSEQSQEREMKAKAKKHLGLVSVAVGQGLVEIFKSLGVDVVITGGQTMNPSTQDIVEAIDGLLAEEVIILPNNSNIILAAQQAVTIATKPCQVVTTKSIPQGIGALMAFNAENDILVNKAKMEEAAKQVVTLEVTYAVRDALFDGHHITQGQILGIVDDKLAVTGRQIEQVVEGLIEKCLQPGNELITIYYGEDTPEADARKLVENLSRKFATVDFELHHGGQPLYYYLISIE